MEQKIWRQVVGYEGFYMVSNTGRVKRIKGGRGARAGKIIKQNLGTCGYMQVVLSKNCVEKTCRVHRIVAEAFLEPVTGKDFVNHKDGNKTNNNVDNLEWCTKSENSLHCYRVLGYKKERAKPDKRRKRLSDKMILAIYNSVGTYADIARQYGISDVMARNIKLGICWSDVTCQSIA